MTAPVEVTPTTDASPFGFGYWISVTDCHETEKILLKRAKLWQKENRAWSINRQNCTQFVTGS